MRWEERAACAGMPTHWWFPLHTGHNHAADRAVEICQGCEVQLDCARHAYDQPEYYGIWGGLTEMERRRSRRSPPSIHGSHAAYMRHIAVGEPACEECKLGHARYTQAQRNRNRKGVR